MHASTWKSSVLKLPVRFYRSFSYLGLVLATLFFACSLTPTLLPRHFVVQGVLSGIALFIGYGLGILVHLLWNYLELPRVPFERANKYLSFLGSGLVTLSFLWFTTVWQNSIRQLMELEPLNTAYPFRVAIIAFAVGTLLILLTRCLAIGWKLIQRRLHRYLPRRLSNILSTLLLGLFLFLLLNKVIARAAIDVADAVFLKLDQVVDEGIVQPTDSRMSGSAESLVDWDSIGRQGKDFIAKGPTQQNLTDFLQKPALQPLRVYVGLGSADSMQSRAKLALEELIRVGGFQRKVLVVATPTGTGWLDPGGVDTLEYLHGGDTAIVSMAYSYLPSWITILIDPRRSRDSAKALFDEIYRHWTTLPKGNRPRIYIHGLSLGSLGAENCADLFTIFEDPIQGGVLSGPPFPSRVWADAIKNRKSTSPMWLPEVRDGSMLRFTSQTNTLNDPGKRWGPMRFVYIQYASDPMVFFSPSLLYRKPDWLVGGHGPDVSPYFRWLPVITFLQVGFDIPMATSVPVGYGHNYSPTHYIDAWMAVTAPEDWSEPQLLELRSRFDRRR